jgi:hypothetical protein
LPNPQPAALEARGDRSIAVRPGSAAPPELLEAIRRHKAELLKLLATVSLQDREEDETDRVARADGWDPPAEIPAAIASEIRRIESQALVLGWHRERLWNHRFWPHRAGKPRGLASVLDPGDRIIEVTADFILIEKSNSLRDRWQFWRSDG